MIDNTSCHKRYLTLTFNCRSILLSLTPPPPLEPGATSESDSSRESTFFSWAAKMATVCGCDSTVPVKGREGEGEDTHTHRGGGGYMLEP